MKRIILLFSILILLSTQVFSFPKKALLERYTNASCGPCASLNSSWYTNTVNGLVYSGAITNIVYNVNWPGDTDPMYLFNAADNATRWSYYGVNAVPWIEIGGKLLTNDQTIVTDSVSSINASFAPFSITLTPEIFSNNTITVKVKIIRDAADNAASYSNTKIRVVLTEKSVNYASAPGTNGEKSFYSVARALIPDAKGTTFTIPAKGDSTQFDLQYVPGTSFTSTVNLDSIRVVAFIQNDDTKEIYQSAAEDLVKGTHINAAFQASDLLGAIPLKVTFTNISTPTAGSSIASYKWDFNNDGTIDSQDPNPTFTFTGKQTYSVSLTVTDNTGQSSTRLISNYITAIGNTADILVVNGIDYSSYATETANFYKSGAGFGNHQVDVWDLFGGQGFDFAAANSNIKQVDLYNKKIPLSVFSLYKKVIWIGNNYNGDLTFYDPAQVLAYVKAGGNFLLAARYASLFFNQALQDYAGITLFSSDLTIAKLKALDNNLVDLTSTGTNSLTELVALSSTSAAVPIFDDTTSTAEYGGFRLHKTGEGNFVFIAGRPYRYDNAASAKDYGYIIDNWLGSNSTNAVSTKENGLPKSFELSQNYPNPFNPSSTIRYAIPNSGFVKLNVYNALGEKVASLVNSQMEAGVYNVNFNASKLASGIYFYRIEAGNFVSVKKMILMK